MQRLLPDAFGQALGAILAEQRKEWSRERERIEADAKALLAETRAELTTIITDLRAENALLKGQIVARLAEVRDGKDGDQGPQGQPGRDADPEEIVQRVMDRLPPPEKGEPGDPETLLPIIERMIDDAVAAKPMPEPIPGADGKDAEVDYQRIQQAIETVVPREVEKEVVKQIAELPPPERGPQGDPGDPGKDVDPEFVVGLVDEAIAAAVHALPPPEKGDPGDPEVLLPVIERMIDDAVAAKEMPEPVPGPQGDPGKDADEEMIVERVLKRIPPPEKGDPGDPGPEVDYELIARMIDDSIKALPTPKDGVGLARALIDRTGSLVLTMTDGSVCELGSVVGKDGEPGKPGKDGLSFDAFELEPEFDGERTVRLKWRDAKGNEQMREWRFPNMIDRGVYRADADYEAGDAVSFGGSIWIAQKNVLASSAFDTKPGNGSDYWRLAVKHGRDGRDGTPGQKGEKGDPGKPGRDLTMMSGQ